MESLNHIKADVLEAINGTQSAGYRELLGRVCEDLEHLKELVANVSEICECQNFEPRGNSIRGMLDEFRRHRNFDERVCRIFARNLSRAIEIYRRKAR